MSRSVWHKEYLDKWSLGTKKGKELMITWVKWGVGGGWTMNIWCNGIPTSVCTYSILHSINTLTCMKDLSIMSIFSLRFNLVVHNAQERTFEQFELFLFLEQSEWFELYGLFELFAFLDLFELDLNLIWTIFRAIGMQGYSVVNQPEQYLLSNVGTTTPLCNR